MISLLNFIPLTALATPISRAQSADRTLDATIETVETMVRDDTAQRLAKQNGLSLVNVTWEDTGRSKNSALGPNISDMTIGVRDSRGKLHPMPVFRFDNYHDKTVDLDADTIWLRTGNESGEKLQSTRLSEILTDLKSYLSNPSSLKSANDDFTASRDSHYLVSAQACFLPISLSGKATFTPVIYNYQSSKGDPAVMTIVATREGTSVQVIENNSGYMSEVLYFNTEGKRAPFTATRLSTFKALGGDATTSAEDATEDAGADVVLVIQVPLKPRKRAVPDLDMPMPYALEAAAPPPVSAKRSRNGRSDVETAVIGHGKTEGKFAEINNLRIERDTRFPIRVTAQFYKATSNGRVNSSDIAALRKQIDQVYADGDFVGSLVTDGHTGRPTEATRPQRASFNGPWANAIWRWRKAY